MSKQVGDRQAIFKKGRDGKSRQPMKNRRHDNTLVLSGGKNGAWTPHALRRTGTMQSLGVFWKSLIVVRVMLSPAARFDVINCTMTTQTKSAKYGGCWEIDYR